MLIRHSPLWPDVRRKPAYGSVEINGGHELAQGLVLYLPINEGAGPTCVDIVTGGIFSQYSDSGPNLRVRGGTALDCGYHQGLVRTGPPSYQVYGSHWSMVALAAKTSAYDNALFSQPTYGGISLNIAADTATWRMTCECDAVGSAFTVDLPVSVLGQWHTYGVSHKLTTNFTPYHDGVSLGTISTARAFFSGAADTRVCPSFFGQIQWAGLWRRELSASEHLQLSTDPYCFLRPRIRRTYGFVGAAAGGGFKAFWTRRRGSGLLTPGVY